MYCKIIDVHAFHGSSDLKPLVVRFTASLFHGTTYLLEQYGIYYHRSGQGLLQQQW
jgi:hypothetical protein